jgi:DNA-binding transcriptional ArsR family regulator
MARQAHPADVFAAIAKPHRREVLALLSDGRDHAVNQIVLRTKLAQPAVSKHLMALRKAGVVTAIKRGQHRLYRLEARGLKPVHDWLKVFERLWMHQIDQIRQRAERKAIDSGFRAGSTAKQREE